MPAQIAAISTGQAASQDLTPGHAGHTVFRSILFKSGVDPGADEREAPETFTDLNLERIVDSVISGRDEYTLRPFFHEPLRDVEAVHYRHDIFRDLEGEALAGHVQSFAAEMRKMRAALGQAGKLYYKLQKQGWFLDSVEIYCGAVTQLNGSLMRAAISSRGFRSLRGYLANYIESGDFRALAEETQKLKADLAAIRYSLHIEGRRVVVAKYDAEPDYSADVLQTFRKFSQGAAKTYRFEHRPAPEMNHVEAAIADLVAELYPEIFSSLDEYCARHRDYVDSTIARFDREVQFYLAWLDHVHRIKQSGLSFCYPEVTDQSKEVYGNSIFDLALADKLSHEKSPVVTNDFYLKDPERIFVVSGPNQGGKTTFARTFGQLHSLAGLGCSVSGKEARLFLCDRIFTHFEKEEDIRNLSGKLEDELRRIHEILDCATSNSILIMNESFLSTTLNDALFLTKQIMQRIVALKMLCVTVTFLDELASFNETTVSMVSTVNPRDPALRTFKVIRKAADGLAYAAAIAQKYRLTQEAVKARIAGNAGNAREGVTS